MPLSADLDVKRAEVEIEIVLQARAGPLLSVLYLLFRTGKEEAHQAVQNAAAAAAYLHSQKCLLRNYLKMETRNYTRHINSDREQRWLLYLMKRIATDSYNIKYLVRWRFINSLKEFIAVILLERIQVEEALDLFEL